MSENFQPYKPPPVRALHMMRPDLLFEKTPKKEVIGIGETGDPGQVIYYPGIVDTREAVMTAIRTMDAPKTLLQGFVKILTENAHKIGLDNCMDLIFTISEFLEEWLNGRPSNGEEGDTLAAAREKMELAGNKVDKILFGLNLGNRATRVASGLEQNRSLRQVMNDDSLYGYAKNMAYMGYSTARAHSSTYGRESATAATIQNDFDRAIILLNSITPAGKPTNVAIVNPYGRPIDE